jgi:hypothetical protein
LKIIVLILMAALTGCATRHGESDKLKAYLAYANQPRTYQSLVLRAAEGRTIHIYGISEMIVEGPLEPMHQMPDTPSVIPSIVSGLTQMAGIGAAAYVLQSATQPTVVHQAPPMVVRPEVVTVVTQ